MEHKENRFQGVTGKGQFSYKKEPGSLSHIFESLSYQD